MSDWNLINKHRIRYGAFATDPFEGFNGAFLIPINGVMLNIIASDGEGWQHVSVSCASTRTIPPSWNTMCQVKDLFWEPEDCVVQYHPAKSEYVNNHPGCLHMWKPTDAALPKPPAWMVGLK